MSLQSARSHTPCASDSRATGPPSLPPWSRYHVGIGRLRPRARSSPDDGALHTCGTEETSGVRRCGMAGRGCTGLVVAAHHISQGQSTRLDSAPPPQGNQRRSLSAGRGDPWDKDTHPDRYSFCLRAGTATRSPCNGCGPQARGHYRSGGEAPDNTPVRILCACRRKHLWRSDVRETPRRSGGGLRRPPPGSRATGTPTALPARGLRPGWRDACSASWHLGRPWARR